MKNNDDSDNERELQIIDPVDLSFTNLKYPRPDDDKDGRGESGAGAVGGVGLIV